MAYLVCDDIQGYIGGKHRKYSRGQKITRKEASRIPNLQILVNVGKLREVVDDVEERVVHAPIFTSDQEG